jgi:hypothetical protein
MLYRDYYSNPIVYEEEDPDQMIKDMIKKSQ